MNENFRVVDLIEKKRDGFELDSKEIEFLISGYVKGEIPDYQMSSFLMAVYFKSMSDEEIFNFTKVMEESGDKIDLSIINGFCADKHSTGGVGDKTTLVLGPMLAAMGINFAKMSGRGLGHTGGTIDKLESIKGYNINIDKERFIKQVNDIHIALVGQSGNIAPADKKIYALRDVTGSVDSIPLIASSIMSKKLACKSNALCLDIKVGVGAFMKDIKKARKLADIMIKIGNKRGLKTTAILTNMNEPLGYAIGNSLEVIEAIETLEGNGPSDLKTLCVKMAAYLAMDAKVAETLEEGEVKALEVINNKSALNKLKELVKAQDGDETYISDKSKFVLGKYVTPVVLDSTGYVESLDALMIGHAALTLGAGRNKLDDKIDYGVGILLKKKVGDFTEKDEVCAYIYSNKSDVTKEIEIIKSAFTLSDIKNNNELILDIIR